MLDSCVQQPHRKIAPPLAGGNDQMGGKSFEGDVPEPGRVVAVRQPGVDADDDRRRARGHEVDELGPSGGILRQHDRTDAATDAHERENLPPTSLDAAHRLEGVFDRYAEQVRRYGGHRRVGEVEPPGHREVDLEGDRSIADELVVDQRELVEGAAEATGARPPSPLAPFGGNVMRSSHSGQW